MHWMQIFIFLHQSPTSFLHPPKEKMSAVTSALLAAADVEEALIPSHAALGTCQYVLI